MDCNSVHTTAPRSLGKMSLCYFWSLPVWAQLSSLLLQPPSSSFQTQALKQHIKKQVASLTSCKTKTKITLDVELLCQEHYKTETLSSDLPILYLTYKTFSTLGILVLLLFNYCYHDNVLEALDITYALQKAKNMKVTWTVNILQFKQNKRQQVDVDEVQGINETLLGQQAANAGLQLLPTVVRSMCRKIMERLCRCLQGAPLW